MPDASSFDAPIDVAADVTTEAATDLRRDDFVAAYCAQLAPCCAAIMRPTDGAACRALLAAMTGGYQPALADACLQSLRLAPDACTVALPPACARAFSAVIASQQPGARCTSSDECLLSPLGTVTCAGAGLNAGHCQVIVRGHAGDAPCAATVDGPLTVPVDPPAAGARAYLCPIADDLYCDDATRACTKGKGAGAACSMFGECGAGFTCDDASARCVPRQPPGAACTVDEACISAVCAEDNHCAPPRSIDDGVAKLCGP